MRRVQKRFRALIEQGAVELIHHDDEDVGLVGHINHLTY